MAMAGRAATAVVFQLFLLTSPLAIVVVLSLVVGLVMVVLFGYTSDQKAIGIAKDQLKAHLLAVRLYRDQIPVVMGSYGKILRGTGRYLKLAFKPLLYVIVPITLLMVQVDRYLGSIPIPTDVPFLLTLRLGEPSSNAKVAEQSLALDAMNGVTLDLPPEIAMTAPPVHINADDEIVWRLAGSKDGIYKVKAAVGGESRSEERRVGEEC